MNRTTIFLITFALFLIFLPFFSDDSGNKVEETIADEQGQEDEKVNIDIVPKIKLTADVCLKLCEPILVDYFVPGYYIVDFANPGHEQVCNSKGCHEFDIACVCADSPTGLDVE